MGDGCSFELKVTEEAGRDNILILEPRYADNCIDPDIVEAVLEMEKVFLTQLTAPKEVEQRQILDLDNEPNPGPARIFRAHNGVYKCDLKEDLSSQHKGTQFSWTKWKPVANNTIQRFGTFDVILCGEIIGVATVQQIKGSKHFDDGTIVVRYPEMCLDGFTDDQMALDWVWENVRKWKNRMGRYGYILSTPAKMDYGHAALVGHPRALKMKHQAPITNIGSGRSYLADISTGVPEDEVTGPGSRATQIKAANEKEDRMRISQQMALTGEQLSRYIEMSEQRFEVNEKRAERADKQNELFKDLVMQGFEKLTTENEDGSKPTLPKAKKPDGGMYG